MQIGKLRINWGNKAKYDIIDEKSILKEIGALQFQLKEILDRVQKNTMSIGAIEQRMDKIQLGRTTYMSKAVKQRKIKEEIVELLKTGEYTGASLRVQLKIGSNSLYSTLKQLLKEKKIVKIKKHRKILYKLNE